MSFLTGGIANLTGLASASNLLQELEGEPTKVQLLRSGVGVIFAFDAVVNEQISRESQPSAFPIESGGIISEHIYIMAPEITLTGLVSDNPIYDDGNRVRQTLGEAAQTLVPPLGVVVAAAAQRIYSVSERAASRSKEAYRTLTEIQVGKPYANPPELPEPFTLITHYARFPNMVVKSLSFPRDSSTAGQCVFTMTLMQLRRVKPQAVNIGIFKVPGLAAAKQELGEADAGDDIEARARAGRTRGKEVEQNAVGYVKSVGSMIGLGG